jgi:hypothetical protein
VFQSSRHHRWCGLKEKTPAPGMGSPGLHRTE